MNWVAEVVHLLEKTGQLEDTYIFFTSDQPVFELAKHGLPSGKGLPYEEDIHVAMSWSGVRAFRQIRWSGRMIRATSTLPHDCRFSGRRYRTIWSTAVRSCPLLAADSGELEWRNGLLIEAGYHRCAGYNRHTTDILTNPEYEAHLFDYLDTIGDENPASDRRRCLSRLPHPTIVKYVAIQQ